MLALLVRGLRVICCPRCTVSLTDPFTLCAVAAAGQLWGGKFCLHCIVEDYMQQQLCCRTMHVSSFITKGASACYQGRACALSCCCAQMSDKEMYQKVISGAMPGTAHFSWVGARAQLLLSQLSTAGLSTKRQCLEHLGSHFRIVLNSPDR